jgi:cytochrome c-type biogenesis protein CcmE
MTNKQKQRLIITSIIIACAILAIGLVLYALNKNINLFFTPSQVAHGDAPKNHVFRIGGLVRHNSIHKLNHGLTTEFTVTDRIANIMVRYTGVLPDLFRDGQGIVVEGKFDHGIFIADQVLAKHDSTYMPPQVKTALTQADIKRLEQQG